MSKVQVAAWRCDECGHVWLSDAKPKRCSSCKARTWDVSGAVEAVLDVAPEVEAHARQDRRDKKAQRHQQLKADALAGLPDTVPPVMLAKLQTRPTDHHPRCKCLRCVKS